MKLDHIKRYLDAGKAAVFVGAGFSKNARMPEHAEMKDWNALGLDFYRKLYGEPEVGSLMFQNPINLATQVEASFGRHELDSLIEQSLPDDVIVHSPLHVSLLNLGWHDVFTTNYDTLLERACLDADKPYTVVYNKDTLLYSTSPRIVKLHGSFPNIHPYIITE
jgi:NAD-dependent SIR2 family protein deacetylase